MSDLPSSPGRQRVAAYAVILRGPNILLARLAPYLVDEECWTLPGGGIDFGEDPRSAVVREVREETGLDVEVGERAWTDSAHRPARQVDGVSVGTDLHAVRLVYEGWVPTDSPEPRVVEVDGSTVDARWVPLDRVLDGTWPVLDWVREVTARHTVTQVQRLAAKGLARRGPSSNPEVLLARLSPTAVSPGRWTLPGGGVDHGEPPAQALAREMLEETGLEASVGRLLGVQDAHFTGTAPTGRHEDFHAVNLVFEVTVAPDLVPQVLETDGTTDAVAWVPVSEIETRSVQVTAVVRFALAFGS